VSDDARVLMQVDLLGRRRHVYCHHEVIHLFTNGSESSAVVRPSGRPLHVAIVRTRAIDWSCVVTKTDERPVGHGCTRTQGRNGEYDIHHRVEVDEKEHGG